MKKVIFNKKEVKKIGRVVVWMQYHVGLVLMNQNLDIQLLWVHLNGEMRYMVQENLKLI